MPGRGQQDLSSEIAPAEALLRSNEARSGLRTPVQTMVPLVTRIGETNFAFGGESIAEQNVSLNVDAVGIQSFPAGIFEGAAIAFEIVADLSAEKIDFAIGRKTGAEKDEAANVEAVGIQRGCRRDS